MRINECSVRETIRRERDLDDCLNFQSKGVNPKKSTSSPVLKLVGFLGLIPKRRVATMLLKQKQYETRSNYYGNK